MKESIGRKILMTEELDVDLLMDTVVEETGDEKDKVAMGVENIVEKFGGLVSRPAAVFLYMKNEHGEDLNKYLDGVQGELPDMDICDIQESYEEVEFKAKISEVQNTFTFNGGDGRGRRVVLYDDTGTITLMLWGDQTELADGMERGDDVWVYGYPDTYKGSLQVKLGKHGSFEKIDED